MSVIALLPLQTLLAMQPDELDALAKKSVNVAQAAKDATTVHKSSFPATGKVICAIEERLNKSKTERLIASNTSLAKYWESITGSKINNHAESCAVAFGAFVRTGLIEEADYDKNTAQCLELAASINTAVGGVVSHDAMVAAAEELKDRSKDSAKNLKEILESVKAPKNMTYDQIEKALRKIYASGGIAQVVATLGAEIAHLENAETAKKVYQGLDTAVSMFAVNMVDGNRRFSDDMIESWVMELDQARQARESAAKPIAIVTAPAPTQAAA